MTTNEVKQETNPSHETYGSEIAAAEVKPSLPHQEQSSRRKAKPLTEKAMRRKMGWAMTMFCESRFDIIRKNLNPRNQAEWDTLSFEKKCSVVQSFVKKGFMI
jgi:hypothetical protein